MFYFISIGSVAQNKIEGIGKFKIQKTTTSSLDSIVKELDYDREKITSWDEYFKISSKENKIAEIFPDTVNKYGSLSYSTYCTTARVFYIPRFKVSGIELKNTYFTFYKDTLIKIKTDYSGDIIDAFETKYGKPVLDKSEKKVECTLTYTGTKVTYKETIYYQYWENENIKCTAAIGEYRSSNCERKILSYISVGIEKLEDVVRECDRKEKDRLNENLNFEKKKKLADF